MGTCVPGYKNPFYRNYLLKTITHFFDFRQNFFKNIFLSISQNYAIIRYALQNRTSMEVSNLWAFMGSFN